MNNFIADSMSVQTWLIYSVTVAPSVAVILNEVKYYGKREEDTTVLDLVSDLHAFKVMPVVSDISG